MRPTATASRLNPALVQLGGDCVVAGYPARLYLTDHRQDIGCKLIGCGFPGCRSELISRSCWATAANSTLDSKAFSERLEAAIARYHANAITTAQVIEELIQLAKDIRAARARGEETGLTGEEIAFYEALAENESAREVMGEPTLRVIAHELVASIKGSVSVDWMHREAARARMRVLVKRLLRKYGYPPDLQDAAVQNVLQQAEALSAEWAA
jgi:type I restriction enzyme, R subunit